MAQKLLGKVKIKVNGMTFVTKKGATLDPGGVTRTTQNGANQVAGYTEEIVNSKIECDVFISASTPLGDVKDAVATFEGDVGRSWVVPQCWRTVPIIVNESEGTAKLVLEGLPAEELS